MARTPRASVSSTSGQGVSRLSYQKAYRMRNPEGSVGVKGPGKLESGSSDRYAKNKSAPKDYGAGDFNVSYGDTIIPTDVKELSELRKEGPSKSSLSLSPGKTRKLK